MVKQRPENVWSPQGLQAIILTNCWAKKRPARPSKTGLKTAFVRLLSLLILLFRVSQD
jgi:hypothetical protein